MSIPPLYTDAELDQEITKAKADLAKARKALSYQVDLGSSRRQVEREKVTELQKLRVGNTTDGGSQAIVGRVFRG